MIVGGFLSTVNIKKTSIGNYNYVVERLNLSTHFGRYAIVQTGGHYSILKYQDK